MEISLEAIGMIRHAILPDHYLYKLASLNNDEMDVFLAEAFKDPIIHEAIYVASPELHSRIQKWLLHPFKNEDIKYAFMQYLLRMSYRATPFGLCACAGIIRVNSCEKSNLTIPNINNLNRNARIDSSLIAKSIGWVTAQKSKLDHVPICRNNTIQRYNSVYHYIAYDLQKSGRRKYRLVEVLSGPLLNYVLDITKCTTTISQIREQISTRYEKKYSTHEINQFISNLIELQILCFDELYALISKNPFNELIEKISTTTNINIDWMLNVKNDIDILSRKPFDGNLESYYSINSKISQFFDHPRKYTTQIDLTCDPFTHGELGLDFQKQILGAADALYKLGTNIKTVPELVAFINIFENRYGESFVPLLEALDDASGIGYNPAVGSRPNLLKNISGNISNVVKNASVVDYIRYAKLIKLVNLNVTNSLYLDLTNEIIDSATRENLVSIESLYWCKIWEHDDKMAGETIELKEVSPNSTSRIFGRFSSYFIELEDMLKKRSDYMARHEDYILAEIVHLPQDRLGNVTSRPKLSDFELLIRTGGSSAESIPLNDIDIGVIAKNIFLRSRKFKKMILPHMSNAHTSWSEESLSIYKFLNAVAINRGCHRPFELRDILPDNKFLPGLRFGKIIITRPTWKIDKEEINLLSKLNAHDRKDFICRWKLKNNVPDWISFGYNDAILPYNLCNKWMLENFVDTLIKYNRESTISDAFPDGMRPALKDKMLSHHHEILLSKKVDSTVITGHESKNIVAFPEQYKNLRAHAGSGWFYFNVYVKPEQQNYFIKEIYRTLKKYIKNKCIQGFFYVRYNDDKGPHVRLRIKSVLPFEDMSFYTAILQVYEEMIGCGVIFDYVMLTYVREVSRYGGSNNLGYCENIFLLDSRICALCLDLSVDTNLNFWIASLCLAIDTALESTGLTKLIDKFQFAAAVAKKFHDEFNFSSKDKKAIGEMYRKLDINEILAPTEKRLRRTRKLFENAKEIFLVNWLAIYNSKPGLTEDQISDIRFSIIHMRLNRLINHLPRLQEAVIWELLKRVYKRQSVNSYN